MITRLLSLYCKSKTTKQYTLAMNKNRQIIGELQDFFRHNDASKAIQSIISIMNCLVIQSQVVGTVKNSNCNLPMCNWPKVTQLSRLTNKNLALTRLNFKFAFSKSSLKNEKAYNLSIDASADNGIGTEPPSGLGTVRKIR